MNANNLTECGAVKPKQELSHFLISIDLEWSKNI